MTAIRNVLAIAGKDIRVYLTTWMSYALFGFFLLMTAFFFTTLVEQYQLVSLQGAQQPWMLEQLNLTDVVMGNVLRNVSVFFLFLLPLLTMRLFSEERKGNTLELLMTVPVRPAEIVLGKYLSALTVMALMLVLTLVFPLLLQVYGATPGGASPLDWRTVMTGYAGMFLLGAGFVAVGLFASAVTDSQIVAAITSFSVLLMFFVVGYAARGKEGFWQGFLEYLSLTNHLEDFVKGVVKLTGVVYYASLAFLGLFLTYRVVEGAALALSLFGSTPMTNETTNRRQSVSGVTLAGRIAGALGIVLVASAPFTWFLTGEGGVLLFGKLALGAVLCAIYLVTNPDFWRRAIGSRSTGLAAMSAVSIVVAFGVVGVVNYVAYKHPREYDFTKEGLYTLSDQTKGVLARLTGEVHVYAFYPSTDRDFPAVQETLARYHGAGDKLVYELVDPQARPDLVEKFKITERGPRIVVTARGQEARAKDASEEELTNAVIKVAEQTSKTVYFLTGHGEHDLDDAEGGEGYKSYADTLKAEGYGVEKLSLLKGKDAAKGATVDVEPVKGATKTAAVPTTPGADDPGKVAVPPGVTVLVVAGPKAPLLPPEEAALEDYLARGGRLLVFLEPDADGGLAGLAKQWHLELHKDLVVDTNPVNRFLGFGPAAPMLEPPEAAVDHPVVKSLVAPVVFMTTRSLGIANGGLTGVEAKSLLESGSSAWGETNLVGGSASFDDKDFAGPVTVMAAATKSVAEGDKRTDEARLVLAGDSQWLDNKYLSVQGNRDLAINVVHWLAEEQARIAIRPRSRGASQLFLTGSQMGQVKFLAQDILPVLVVAFGLGIVLVRRRR